MFVFTYTAPDVCGSTDAMGFMRWNFGDRIQWFVLVVNGEIRGRRRTRAELSELV